MGVTAVWNSKGKGVEHFGISIAKGGGGLYEGAFRGRVSPNAGGSSAVFPVLGE